MQTDAALATSRPRPPGRRERTPEATAASAVLAALNEPTRAPAACPGCGGNRLQRWGFSGGLQRFRCVACHRCCNPLTGTPLARLRRRDLWLDYAQALHDGLSIRAAGRRLGLHHNTTFRWRHRWLLHPGAQRDGHFQGIVEADVIDFFDVRTRCRSWRRVAIARPCATAPEPPPTSATRPAAAVLVMRDRQGGMLDFVIGPEDLTTLRTTTVEQALAGIVDRAGAVLCSNGSPIFHRVARNLEISHHPITHGSGSRVFNLDDVRGCGRRLERWMRRFRGVSTRYLVNYLGWRRILERHRLPLPQLTWLQLALRQQHWPTVATDRAPLE